MTKSSMLINEHTCPQNPESVKYSALKSACCTNAGAGLTAHSRSGPLPPRCSHVQRVQGKKHLITHLLTRARGACAGCAGYIYPFLTFFCSKSL